jgi:hypothetical protein
MDRTDKQHPDYGPDYTQQMTGVAFRTDVGPGADLDMGPLATINGVAQRWEIYFYSYRDQLVEYAVVNGFDAPASVVATQPREVGFFKQDTAEPAYNAWRRALSWVVDQSVADVDENTRG